MKLYVVEEIYIKYLNRVENKEAYNKNKTRPYIGIVLSIEGREYYAPLSSPKTKHKNMIENISFLKIKNGELGVINLNNMIPINSNHLKFYQTPNQKHNELLKDQSRWLTNNKKKIVKKAETLYKLAKKRKLPRGIYKVCNNFEQLEKKYEEYLKVELITKEIEVSNKNELERLIETLKDEDYSDEEIQELLYLVNIDYKSEKGLLNY